MFWGRLHVTNSPIRLMCLTPICLSVCQHFGFRLACPIEEGEVSDHEQDTTTVELDQALSEEQTYERQ